MARIVSFICSGLHVIIGTSFPHKIVIARKDADAAAFIRWVFARRYKKVQQYPTNEFLFTSFAFFRILHSLKLLRIQCQCFPIFQ